MMISEFQKSFYYNGKFVNSVKICFIKSLFIKMSLSVCLTNI